MDSITCLPKGFSYSGLHCGIKKSGALDLALIMANEPCTAVGMYTQYLVRAASIDWNRTITPCDSFKAVVVNSGNANACTGAQGVADNSEMARLTAEVCSVRARPRIQPQQIAVLSTGVIGQLMPMDKVRSGIRAAHAVLGASSQHFASAANAILTTDRGPKTAYRRIETGQGTRTIVAMAKGAGMIGPNMATMLGVIMSDFPMSVEAADQAIRTAVGLSFNRISVEGHTSTSDAVLLLCPRCESGLEIDVSTLGLIQENLNSLCIELAKRIPTDGEGASHLIHITVTGTATAADADRIARCIALSNLVKTAISGADPNWGRIVSAAGYAGVSFSVDQTDLRINGHVVFLQGQPAPFDPTTVSKSIRNTPQTEIELSVGRGPGQIDHWTSDLTADYVKLNAEYTT